MALLSLDLGWQYGYCLVRRGDHLTSGSVDLRKHNPTDGMRLLTKRQWLTSLLGQLANAGERLDAIYFEEINFVGKNGVAPLHAHGAQLGTVQSWCALKKVPEPIGIPWDYAKKHLTGHRSAARETVFDEIKKRYPSVKDPDEASAVAVMLAARTKFQTGAVR
jgi:hypothetical protein